jgi:hypothetical protein
VTGREPWRFLAGPGAVSCRPGRGAARRALRAQVLALPPGTPVVLLGARGRCRRFAAESGVLIEAEYLAAPSVRAPLYLVQDVEETVLYFWSDLLVLPLAAPLLPLAALAVALLRRLGAWRWAALLPLGRVALGIRR